MIFLSIVLFIPITIFADFSSLLIYSLLLLWWVYIFIYLTIIPFHPSKHPISPFHHSHYSSAVHTLPVITISALFTTPYVSLTVPAISCYVFRRLLRWMMMVITKWVFVDLSWRPIDGVKLLIVIGCNL